MRAWLLVLVGCVKGDPPPTRDGDAATTAELVAEPPLRTPPPVEHGYVRIEPLGIDMRLPADAKVTEASADGATVELPGCRMSIRADPGAVDFDLDPRRNPEFPERQVVGTLVVQCTPTGPRTRHCLAMCEGMKPTPRGRLDRPAFPPQRAAIVTANYNGSSGTSLGSAEIWLDGTVRFGGGTCASPRRAKMPAARVETLIADLARAGVFEWPTQAPEPECCDCSGGLVSVRARGKSVVSVAQCASPSKSHVAANELIAQAVGRNPCVQ